MLAGNVLKDIINAIEEEGNGEKGKKGDGERTNPHSVLRTPHSSVVRLQTIFRQAAGSFIISNAHRINQGQMPIIDNDQATDFFLFKTEEPERAAQLCVELVQGAFHAVLPFPGDIQVLCPMSQRGWRGCAQRGDQTALNPYENKPQKRDRQPCLSSRRPGDADSQQLRQRVYNGDVGVISAVDVEMQKIKVNIDGREVSTTFLNWTIGARLY